MAQDHDLNCSLGKNTSLGLTILNKVADPYGMDKPLPMIHQSVIGIRFISALSTRFEDGKGACRVS